MNVSPAAAEALKGHKIRWFVWAGSGVDRVKIPRESTMRGQWGYDVECSCGWKTTTGGGVKRWVDDLVWGHKFDVRCDADEAAEHTAS